MKKIFEHRGYPIMIDVTINYRTEKRMGGMIWHRVRIGCIDIGYNIDIKDVEDSKLVEVVQTMESNIRLHIDNMLDGKKKDERLIALGFQ